MSTVTYKCPNCDAGLIYDPKTEDFVCEFCASRFTQEALEKMDFSGKNGPAKNEENEETEFSENTLYHCPSCGAEIIADETTAAKYCVYCHNPVILSGKVEGEFRPDYLVPFLIDKTKVYELFQEWCKKKKFIQDEFLKEANSELLMGVYYPFWFVDCQANAGMSLKGEKVRTWRSGNYEYTEVKTYTVIREGNIDFNDIYVTALNKKQVNILNGVHPYDMSKMVPFSSAFFSGFLAEKRNIEKEAARPAIEEIMRDSSRQLLLNTVQGYSSVSVISEKAVPQKETWQYIMLPAWMFNYKYKGEDYYFAMNGETGKIAGRVPASPKKLLALFAGLTAGIAAIMMLVGWLA
jgi:DNA-directed RNA polymerase subunit RPC12/RpoP